MKSGLLRICLVVSTLVSFVLGALSNSQLQSLVKSQGRTKVITLTDENYEQILNGPRDYYLVVLLTSEAPQINCVLCKEFRPEFELLANSWVQDHPDGLTKKELEINDEDPPSILPKNVYFLRSEFMESRSFFQIFALNSIPKVFLFPPSEKAGPNNFIGEVKEYQFFAGSHSELLKAWVSDQTGHKLNIYIPTDYYRIGINVFSVVTLVLLLVRVRKQVASVVTSRVLWSGLSLIAILLLTTGYMFNQIRGVPYHKEHENGKIEYFMPGQQNQFGVETQIVSFIYGMLSLLVIVLIKRVPEIKSSSVFLTAVIFVSTLIFLFYSLLLSIFGVKGVGFPYKLLELF